MSYGFSVELIVPVPPNGAGADRAPSPDRAGCQAGHRVKLPRRYRDAAEWAEVPTGFVLGAYIPQVACHPRLAPRCLRLANPAVRCGCDEVLFLPKWQRAMPPPCPDVKQSKPPCKCPIRSDMPANLSTTGAPVRANHRDLGWLRHQRGLWQTLRVSVSRGSPMHAVRSSLPDDNVCLKHSSVGWTIAYGIDSDHLSGYDIPHRIRAPPGPSSGGCRGLYVNEGFSTEPSGFRTSVREHVLQSPGIVLRRNLHATDHCKLAFRRSRVQVNLDQGRIRTRRWAPRPRVHRVDVGWWHHGCTTANARAGCQRESQANQKSRHAIPLPSTRAMRSALAIGCNPRSFSVLEFQDRCLPSLLLSD